MCQLRAGVSLPLDERGEVGSPTKIRTWIDWLATGRPTVGRRPVQTTSLVRWRRPPHHFRGLLTFEACSGFTRVTSRRIAQPPKVTFVTRLQPCQLPGRAARLLPDLSTIIQVEPSSTDNSRLRGALPACDIGGQSRDQARRRKADIHYHRHLHGACERADVG